MVNEIDTKALYEQLNVELKNAITDSFNEIQKIESEIGSLKTETDLRMTLTTYLWLNNENDRLHKIKIEDRIKVADLFNDMARSLSHEFNDTIVDTENFTICFKWFGNTLSFPLEMLAAKFNLHAGMFSFRSSFTTHEAYTENNYCLHIGIKSGTDDTIEINFGKLNKLLRK